MSWQVKNLVLKSGIHVIALSLLISQYYWAVNDQLGGDPVEAIIHFTGIGAFNLLLLTLSISPLAKYFKQAWLMKSRRMLGLYSFTYAFCHVANFWAFEIQFQVNLFVEELVKRPYITFGLVAFIILMVLAVTSFAKIQRAMGKRWQTLHNLVYLAVCLVAIHFYWSVKSEIIEPSLYILMTLALLLMRHKKIRRWF